MFIFNSCNSALVNISGETNRSAGLILGDTRVHIRARRALLGQDGRGLPAPHVALALSRVATAT